MVSTVCDNQFMATATRGRTSFGKDTGLQARMLLTMFLLGLVYTVFIGVLFAAELEGVMAHELTHVINRDVMVMTLASFFATLASMILQFAFFFGGGFGNREEERDIEIVVLVSMLVYAISFLLLRALSRYREFSADRGSAVLTGRPSALASALIKISGTID